MNDFSQKDQGNLTEAIAKHYRFSIASLEQDLTSSEKEDQIQSTNQSSSNQIGFKNVNSKISEAKSVFYNQILGEDARMSDDSEQSQEEFFNIEKSKQEAGFSMD